MPDLPAIEFDTPTSPAGQVLASASGSALDRPTLLEVRKRVIEMAYACERRAMECAEDDVTKDYIYREEMGMMKVRQMIGEMLDEQEGRR